ncbi:hypothetical protein SAY86_028806 [Trapa natans]|uniref:RING-type E3 ubiquitin transferase n=1 Tax=Trapa natans TaxID=22666 RepID=A0AAN7MG12_TRANT|nr:hypothetical protein SAY86_028806 [Trapa natans]
MDDVSIRSRLSASSEGFESAHWGSIFGDHGSLHDILPRDCSASIDSHSAHHLDEVETEMRRLKQEVQQTMNMYNTACKEALTAKEKARELHRWRLDEEQKLEEARLAQEAALSIAEKQRTKCRAAIEQAGKAKRIAELESQRRINMEMRARSEAQEMKKILGRISHGRCEVQEILHRGHRGCNRSLLSVSQDWRRWLWSSFQVPLRSHARSSQGPAP